MDRAFEVKAESGAVDNTPADIAQSIWRLVISNRLCSIATVGPGPVPHINTCFYGVTPSLNLIIFTAPSSRHATYLAENGRFAVSIFDSHQEWGGIIYGVQLFGVGSECTEEDAESSLAHYAEHNPGMSQWARTPSDILEKFESRLYRLKVDRFTLLDEASFGKEGYISGTVLVRQ